MAYHDEPFHTVLQEIMYDEEIGHRELTRRCRAHGWGSLGTINRLVRGEIRPSMRAMRAIAHTLQIPPETFAEYRLAVMREQLDPESVGLPTALENLSRCLGED